MKKLLFLLLFCASAFGQGFRVDLPPIINGQGKPVANVQVTVCTSGASGFPCSPQSSTFTDITLGTPCGAGFQVTLTNTSICQATSDSLGNAGFWIAPGTYKYTLTGPNITPQLYNLTVPVGSGTSPTLTNVTITGALTVTSGRPWIDVTGFPFLAVCDWNGTTGTDNSTALQSAATAANVAGFDMFVPNTSHACAFGTTLNMASFTGVHIVGSRSGGGQTNGVQTVLPSLVYTGSGTQGINCNGCQNFGISGVQIQYTNVAFTGVLLDLSQGAAPAFTQTVSIENCSLAGNGTAKTAAALIALDNTDEVDINNCSFNWANAYIRGTTTPNVHFSNTVHIRNSVFNAAGTAIGTGPYIANPGQSWVCDHCTFEMLGDTNQSIVDASDLATGLVTTVGMQINVPWIGDAPAGYNGFMFKPGNGGGQGLGFSIQGGYIQGGSSNLGTVLKTGGQAHGQSIHGVSFLNLAGIANLGGASDNKGIDYAGNSYFNVTAILTNANPASGETEDLNGNRIFWCRTFEACQLQGGGGLLMQGPLAMAETTAPTPQATQAIVYADSTGHMPMLSNNGGTFSPLGTNKVTLAADWTCGTAGTVASCVAATIIGSGGGVPLTFTLPLVAGNYKLECDLVVGQATGDTANQWNLLTATNGATNVTATYSMATAATASAYGAVTDQASTTTTFQILPSWTLGGLATKMPVHIYADIQGASASGTVLSLQLAAPTVGDLVTIYRGSGCRIS